MAPSIKQLNCYQDQNNYDIIALQETNSRERERALSHLKIGKQKVAPQSWIKKFGYGVVTVMKRDIKYPEGRFIKQQTGSYLESYNNKQ